MAEFTLVLDEGERQMVVMALAKLALQRPGWDVALWEIAERISDREMYEAFRGTLRGTAKKRSRTEPLPVVECRVCQSRYASYEEFSKHRCQGP